MKHAVAVHAEHAAPIRHGGFVQRLEISGHAGVVEDDIDLAVPRYRLRDPGLNGSRVGDVELEGHRVGKRVGDVPGGVAIDIHDRARPAFACEALGGCGPDSGSSAGDEDALAVKPHSRSLLFCIRSRVGSIHEPRRRYSRERGTVPPR